MPYCIQAEKVAFIYPQEGRGLEPISLDLKSGQCIHIAGISGCGKSTLARCLAGLIPHLYRGEMRGSVTLNGIASSDAPLWQLAEQVGMVFQNPAMQMLAATVEEEILFGLENLGLEHAEMEKRLEDALDDFNLQPLRERSPRTLSGGEQQKVALAAALARRPPALVLDEPLSMLDTTAAQDLVNLLQRAIGQRAGVIICEHRGGYLDGLKNLHRIEMGSSKPPAPNFPEPPPLPQARRFAPFSVRASSVSVNVGPHTLLHPLDLEMESGQVVALVGRNGVGKTTFLRALCGLQAYEGSMTLDSGEQPDFGMVFQNPDLQIFNASVREEILYGLPQPDLDLYRWLVEALGLEIYENTPPLLLSEGEKRRVALATALVHRPRHGILLDEPSLGQDVYHKHILINMLRMVAAAGHLVLLTTHDLELAAQADRLVLMNHDGILAQGKPQEVFANHPAWQQAGLLQPEWMGLCSN